MNRSSPRSPAPARRPLTLDALRTFDAVARRLSFSQAAEDVHLTQPAVSRRIQALEDELGQPLFVRGTRRVELTEPGLALQQAVVAALDRIDRTVARLRAAQRRRHVNVGTYATFATLWLLPRLAAFQQMQPDVDIRITATDRFAADDDPDIDVALRQVPSSAAARPPTGRLDDGGREFLFDELRTVVCGAARHPSGAPPRPLRDLAQMTLLTDDDARPASSEAGWRRWLARDGAAAAEPPRRLVLNYTHQQVQAAVAGHGVALVALALVHDALARGELAEPFGEAGRIAMPRHHELVVTAHARERADVAAFTAWVRDEAAATRRAIDAWRASPRCTDVTPRRRRAR